VSEHAVMALKVCVSLKSQGSESTPFLHTHTHTCLHRLAYL